MASNNRGFVLTLLLVALPMLLSFMLVGGAMGLVQLEYSRRAQICRQKGLELESRLAQIFNQLFKLNHKAKKLRRERKIAEHAVATGAAIPAVEMSAQAYRTLVIARQMELRGEQESLLQQAHLEIAQQTGDLKHQLRDNEPSFVSYHHPPEITPPRMALIREPPLDLTPDFIPAIEFAKWIRMEAKLNFLPQDILPSWLTRITWIETNHKEVEVACTATLEQNQDRWKAVLGAGKSWSKRL